MPGSAPIPAASSPWDAPTAWCWRIFRGWTATSGSIRTGRSAEDRSSPRAWPHHHRLAIGRGQRRIGYRRIAEYPIYVSAGLETSAIRARWFATMGQHLVFGIPATALLFLLLAFAFRRTHCCGIERIYVHESLYDAFVEKAVAWVKRAKLGNPLDPETTLVPWRTSASPALVREHIAEAVAQGAVAHIDTMPGDDGGTYVTPQVLTNVTHAMRVMREETFGPVVGIMPVRDDEEAIRLMNDSDFGLTASIWTADVAAAERIGARHRDGHRRS